MQKSWLSECCDLSKIRLYCKIYQPKFELELLKAVFSWQSFIDTVYKLELIAIYFEPVPREHRYANPHPRITFQHNENNKVESLLAWLWRVMHVICFKKLKDTKKELYLNQHPSTHRQKKSFLKYQQLQSRWSFREGSQWKYIKHIAFICDFSTL